MIRIYADFNTQDEQGRVVLTAVGSRRDIEEHEGMLAEGMVLLYMTDEFEVEGTLVFDRVWNAIPNYATLHYINPEDQK